MTNITTRNHSPYLKTKAKASFIFMGCTFEIHAARYGVGEPAIRGAWVVTYKRHALRGTDWIWDSSPLEATRYCEKRLERAWKYRINEPGVYEEFKKAVRECLPDEVGWEG